MKSTIAVILLATSVFAESTSNFEVKEIDHARVGKLSVLESRLESAMNELKMAQGKAESAKRDRDEVLNSIKSEFGDYDSGCRVAGSSTGVGYYTRSFQKVEIKGKYALITSGTENCSSITLTNATTGIGNVVNGSANYYDAITGPPGPIGTVGVN